ncbi:MAG TPA: DUF192 domain-containing protein [Gaiellaceae bacterium]|nr:DUF192 domain-containing protein [Gaiellaceae bacterium]
MRPVAVAVSLLAVVPLAACGGGSETGRAVLEGNAGSVTVSVEVADSPAERAQGLKGRENLASDAGMVFLFGEPVLAEFVMEDTLIPLSIAFADADGRIVAVEDMEPCRARPCPTYGAGRPFTTALEVNEGAFDRWGIGVGDRLRVELPEG